MPAKLYQTWHVYCKTHNLGQLERSIAENNQNIKTLFEHNGSYHLISSIPRTSQWLFNIKLLMLTIIFKFSMCDSKTENAICCATTKVAHMAEFVNKTSVNWLEHVNINHMASFTKGYRIMVFASVNTRSITPILKQWPFPVKLDVFQIIQPQKPQKSLFSMQ